MGIHARKERLRKLTCDERRDILGERKESSISQARKLIRWKRLVRKYVRNLAQ